MDGHEAGYVHAVAGIVDEVIKAYEKQEPVNMTRLKNDVAKRYKLPSMPKVRCPSPMFLPVPWGEKLSFVVAARSSSTLSRPCQRSTKRSCCRS
jgi:hypothetical protein